MHWRQRYPRPEPIECHLGDVPEGLEPIRYRAYRQPSYSIASAAHMVIAWIAVTIFVLLIILAVSLSFMLAAKPSLAQHNHDRHHSDYLDWSSTKVRSCCDHQDCGVMHEHDVRESATGPEVRIADQWCPVLQEHYLIRGRSPDWNAVHACIRKLTTLNAHEPPCVRLLCFAGRGGV